MTTITGSPTKNEVVLETLKIRQHVTREQRMEFISVTFDLAMTKKQYNYYHVKEIDLQKY